jgi:hypothetical protein
MRLRIGQVLRLASPKSTTPDLVDGFVNFYAATALPGGKLVTLDSGINRIRSVSTPEGERAPASAGLTGPDDYRFVRLAPAPSFLTVTQREALPTASRTVTRSLDSGGLTLTA